MRRRAAAFGSLLSVGVVADSVGHHLLWPFTGGMLLSQVEIDAANSRNRWLSGEA